MTEEKMAVVVLDVVEPSGVLPDYCIHGKVTCINCDEWCWLGDETFQVVTDGKVQPLCEPCAIKLIPPDAELIGNVVDHRRADGPH